MISNNDLGRIERDIRDLNTRLKEAEREEVRIKLKLADAERRTADAERIKQRAEDELRAQHVDLEEISRRKAGISQQLVVLLSDKRAAESELKKDQLKK